MIPINITNNHFFLICVFLKRQTIQVYDSCPDDETGCSIYLNHIFLYLQEEHRHIYDGTPLPNIGSWQLKHCSVSDSVPQQGTYTNDCGVYTCLFMDFLLLNQPLEGLLQARIARYGREWLCKCVIDKAIVF